MKPQEINNVIPQKPKEGKDTHTHSTKNNNKITRTNNHWSLISLKINELSSLIKKTWANKTTMD